MTLVETMSPAVKPSVDCVLNREWRSGTGPRARAMQLFLGRAKSKASVRRKGCNWAELCKVLCQYQVTRTAARGPRARPDGSVGVSVAGSFFTGAQRGALCWNALDEPARGLVENQSRCECAQSKHCSSKQFGRAFSFRPCLVRAHSFTL